MALLRTAVASLVALGITFALFWVMQFLISRSEGKANKLDKGPSIEFVRLRRDTETETRKRELPKKEKPPEAPPPPELRMARADAPAANALAIGAPSVDVKPDMRGGLSLGSGASDSDSVPIVRVQPQYPMRAAERGIEGWVLVEFTITSAGTVRDVVVRDAEPPRIFDRAAIQAVEKWKFRPRVVDGVAVERVERTKLTFELETD